MSKLRIKDLSVQRNTSVVPGKTVVTVVFTDGTEIASETGPGHELLRTIVDLINTKLSSYDLPK